MSDKHVVEFDDPDHHHSVQRLLPWYVNGTLDQAENAKVERHLSHCVLCRADMQAQRLVRLEVQDEFTVPDPGPAFERLRAALGQPAMAAGPRGRHWRGLLHVVRASSLGVRSVMAVQVGVIVVLGALLMRVSTVPSLYVTRSEAPAASAGSAGSERILVDFAGTATVAQLRHALLTAHARISDGPTETGACVLEVPAGTSAAALVALRSEPGVRLAESLGPGNGP